MRFVANFSGIIASIAVSTRSTAPLNRHSVGRLGSLRYHLETVMTEPVSALTVIYANDLDRVAAFYERTLGVSRLEQEEGFIVVGNSSFEIAVVRMSGMPGSSEPPSSFHVRAETPLKGSYLVKNLAQAKAAAEASGGSLKPVDSAWSWRGQLHLDGHDPEGNVMQIRTSAA